MCVVCGTPTGVYMQHQGKGVGCTGLIVGFIIVVAVLTGIVGGTLFALAQ